MKGSSGFSIWLPNTWRSSKKWNTDQPVRFPSTSKIFKAVVQSNDQKGNSQNDEEILLANMSRDTLYSKQQTSSLDIVGGLGGQVRHAVVQLIDSSSGIGPDHVIHSIHLIHPSGSTCKSGIVNRCHLLVDHKFKLPGIEFRLLCLLLPGNENHEEDNQLNTIGMMRVKSRRKNKLPATVDTAMTIRLASSLT